METIIKDWIQAVLEDYSSAEGFDLPGDFEFELQVSRDPTHGDFAVNAALKLARVARKSPKVIAESFQEKLTQKISDSQTSIERVEVAGAGFLNFYVKKGSLAELLLEIKKQDDDFGGSEHGAGEKVIIEYVSANPTGPLTIAHGRQAAIGDCLVRILRKTGHEVCAEYYLNDAGRQMNLLGASVFARYLDLFEMENEFPEDGYKGEYIGEIAKLILDQEGDRLLKEDREDALAFVQGYAKDFLMSLIKEDLARAGVAFDNYFSERTLYEKDKVEETLNDLRKGDYLYEEDGALWFKSTQFADDKDRVVKKSSGDYTYLAPDIAYHREKFQREFTRIVNLMGPDHHGYIERLKASCQALGFNREAIHILIVQLVTLYRNGEPARMSTRAGEFVSLKELMDEVGVDATRFFFCMRRVETPLDFDLELAKQKSDENPVYYLQYAHARISSILRNAEQEVATDGVDLTLLSQPEELDLIKVLGEFPKILISAGEMLEPYRVVDYLKTLAASYHKFYAQHRVLSDDEAMTKARLLLCDGCRIVLRNGLRLLGISQPEKM